MLRIKKLHQDAILPARKTYAAAGYDLSSIEDMTIPPGGTVVVPTGLALTVPFGTYGRIAPRSGLAAKHSIGVGAGVVDRDYTGPLGVVLFNHDLANPFHIKKHDRIAQLILEKIELASIAEVDELVETARGGGGFGSTDLQ